MVLHLSKLLGEVITFASHCFPWFFIAKDIITQVSLDQAKKFQFLLFKYHS